VRGIDHLHREYDRVRIFTCFDSSQRIWWIYLREAVEDWLERNEDAAVRAAFGRLKTSTEDLPDEGARWLELRNAVKRVIQKHQLA